MFSWMLYLIFLLNLAHGSTHVREFINDLLELPEVNQCDFGYVYEKANGKSTHTENTILRTVDKRYYIVKKMTLSSN